MTATIIQPEQDFEAIPGTALIVRDRSRINAGQQDLAILTEKTWKALKQRNHPPELFKYDGRVVRVVEENGLATISDVGRAEMYYELGERVDFYRTVRDDEVPARPPTDLATNLLATPNPPLPILKCLTLVPTFAPDGKFAVLPGLLHEDGHALPAGNGDGYSARRP